MGQNNLIFIYKVLKKSATPMGLMKLLELWNQDWSKFSIAKITQFVHYEAIFKTVFLCIISNNETEI